MEAAYAPHNAAEIRCARSGGCAHGSHFGIVVVDQVPLCVHCAREMHGVEVWTSDWRSDRARTGGVAATTIDVTGWSGPFTLAQTANNIDRVSRGTYDVAVSVTAGQRQAWLSTRVDSAALKAGAWSDLLADFDAEVLRRAGVTRSAISVYWRKV